MSIINFGKRSYRVGDVYEFKQLPKEAAHDAEVQLSNAGVKPSDMLYKLRIIGRDDLEVALEKEFGPDLPEMIEGDRVKKLVRSIEKSGLKSPPIGREGFHRMMAFLVIGEGIPYFEIITRDGDSFYADDEEESES